VAGGQIQLVALTKRFTEVAVDGIDLTVSSGEFFSLLGPSGCGKTTTLRLVAGFEQPTAGKIMLDGADVTGIPPHKRNVNTVFQSYALFPFLSVFDNVAFGLRHRDVSKADLARRVGEALELVQLTGYSKRRPGMLSGGQQQRVALARALVLNPAVLLLDEPLGALDAKLRRSLKVELKALQERVGITFLYVTHDQEEALTMSDRLAVMNSGRIVQTGAPRQVYEEPGDTYVADFLGVSNLMEVDVVERGPGQRCHLKIGDAALTSERGEVDGLGTAHAVIRPERVRIEPYGTGGPNRVPAMVERLVFLGAATQVMLRLGAGMPLQALVQNDGEQTGLAQGSPVHVFLPPDGLRVLGGDSRVVPVAPEDDSLVSSQPGAAARPAQQLRPADTTPDRRRGGGLGREVGAPLRHPHDARLHQLQPSEEPHHLAVAAVGLRHRKERADPLSGLRHGLLVDVGGHVGQRQVAAARRRAGQRGHDAVGVVLVAHQVQHRHEHDRHRLAEVQRPGRPGQDQVGVAQVGVDMVDGPFQGSGEQGPRLGYDHRVVVHVDHPGVRRDRLGDLVGVVRGGQAGADVEELADADLGGQVAHRAGEEGPVRPGREDQVRVGLEGRVAGRPVHRVVVDAAEPVVVDPGDVCHAGVKGLPLTG
jgi:spermidine/putrescine transport system ATP-binding protein